MSKEKKESKLKVWWIPQIPGKPFEVRVQNLREADLLLTTLADYDIFQLENNIKPDYSNVGGLQIFDEVEQEWYDWNDEETGMDFDEYREEVLYKNQS